MRGLDPRIHLSRRKLDGRVKPGHDAERVARYNFNEDLLRKLPMLSQEQNDLITRIGPGTAAGDLMRRYWQPVALVDELRGPTGRSSRSS